MKKNLLLLLLLFCSTISYAQICDSISSDTTIALKETRSSKQSLLPKFTATILGRYECNTQLGTHHFELRHTRVGMSGDLHPMFSYMALVDLSYGGGFSPVAIFAKIKPVKGLSLLIGYDKLPFSNENLLSPWKYYFSDKSFLTQRITGWSDVGAVVEYQWEKTMPFSIKAGVFNSGGFSKQMQFQKTLNYVARGTFQLLDDLELALNYAAIKHELLRMHHLNVGLQYDIRGLHLDAEYIYKWYDTAAFVPTHALQGFASYAFLVGKPYLQQVALAVRYDAISANCNGKLNDLGDYTWDSYRQRLTAGISLIFSQLPIRTGLRLNYEKFFAHEGEPCTDDRFILELFTHF